MMLRVCGKGMFGRGGPQRELLALWMGAVSLAGCHSRHELLDIEPAPAEFGASPFVSELCPEGVLIGNVGVGEQRHLSVRDVDCKGGPQELEMLDVQDDTRSVWRLIHTDPELGSYQIQNLRPPYNFLSSRLVARGASPYECDETAAPSPIGALHELDWTFVRIGVSESEEPQFEIVSVQEPERRLMAASAAPYGLGWGERAAGGSTPTLARWTLIRLSLCEL